MAASSRAWFDEVAPWFAGFSQTGAFEQRIRAFSEQAAVLTRPPHRPPRCLDLGCGPGGLATAFAAQGFEVIGVDSSPRMLEQARQAAAQANLPITYIQGDVTEDFPALQFPPELIVCSSVLEYVEDPEAVITRSAGVLAPGGLLLVSVPNRASLPRRQQQALYALRRQPSYLDQQRSPISYRELARMGRAAGLEPVSVRHFSAPRLLIRWAKLRFIGTLTVVAFRKPLS